MSPRVVMVTGASRGIGKGLVTHYLTHSFATVIAGVRNPQCEESAALQKLPVGDETRLIVVQFDSTSTVDAKNAARDIRSKYGIMYIDIAIANAGICDHLLPVADIDLDELHRHVDTNAYGVLRLFQAIQPMLQKSTAPKFVYISSELGSITSSTNDRGSTGVYGFSKAAANFLVSKIGAEHQYLVAFSIDPGLVQTDMGNRGAKFAGLEVAPVTLQQSVDGIAREIINATRQGNHGLFRSYNGGTIAW